MTAATQSSAAWLKNPKFCSTFFLWFQSEFIFQELVLGVKSKFIMGAEFFPIHVQLRSHLDQMLRRFAGISARRDDTQRHVRPLLVTTKSFCGVPEKDCVALGTKLNGVGGEVVLLALRLVPIQELSGLVHPLLEVSGRKRLVAKYTGRQSNLSLPVLPSHLAMILLDLDLPIPKLDLVRGNRTLDEVTGTRIYATKLTDRSLDLTDLETSSILRRNLNRDMKQKSQPFQHLPSFGAPSGAKNQWTQFSESSPAASVGKSWKKDFGESLRNWKRGSNSCA